MERRIWLPCVLTVLGLAGGAHWTLELMSAYRAHLGAGFLLTLVLAAVRRRRGLALVSAAGAVLNLWSVATLYDGPEPAPTNGPRLRLILVNVRTENPRRADVLEYVRTCEADVIGLLEVNGEWVSELGALAPTYRQLAAVPRADNFGVTLLTRLEGVEARVVMLDPDNPAIEARIPWHGGTLDVLVVHPLAPYGAAYAAAREGQLDALAAWAVAREGSAVVLADLNATPWSASFGALLDATGLEDSTRGWGFQPTWPAFFPPLSVPLDHCLHDASLAVTSRSTGPRLGSDHLPLEIEFASR